MRSPGSCQDILELLVRSFFRIPPKKLV